jgi:hypothetical protein
VAALERRAEEVRAQGGLEPISAFRTYEPARRVAARLELTGPGLVRRSEAGLDVMGDGTLVPYRGTIFKRRLEPPSGGTAYDAVRRELAR